MGRNSSCKDFVAKYNTCFKTPTQKQSLAKYKQFRQIVVALARDYPEDFLPTLNKANSECQKALKKCLKKKGPEREPEETPAQQPSQCVDLDLVTTEAQDEGIEGRIRVKVEQTFEQSPFLNRDEDVESVSSVEGSDSAQNDVDEQDSRHDKELQLLRGDLPESLRQRCLSQPGEPSQRREHKEKSLARLRANLARLDLEVAKESLLDFLRKRLEQPGLSGIPDITRELDLGDSFYALEDLNDHEDDVKIYRAFGLIKQYLKIKIQVEQREREGVVSCGRKSMHTLLLEESVLKKARGPMTPERLVKIRKACVKQYNAGLNWLHTIKCFGGQGIVFFFVMAGINPGDWVEYQRRCLRLIARELHEGRRMVEVLGQDCLSDYCEKGYIAKPVVDRIHALELYPDGEAMESDEPKRIGDVSDVD